MPPLIEHLYIHIPFCHRICPYCSFYKHTPGPGQTGDLVPALLAEAEAVSHRWEVAPRTVYLGGGTPSLLTGAQIGALMRGLRERFDFSSIVECSLEANPMTFGADKAAAFQAAGVNRVSLGVQSWDPDALVTLGRDHSAEAAEEAYQQLRSIGFSTVSIDLMFSVPGQALDTWLDSVEHSIALAPDHLSAYNLNYEEDTAFFERLNKGEFTDSPEADAAFFLGAGSALEEAGFEHYEVSNYAKPGHRSLHNQAYWEGRDYLSLGPGAVSTIGKDRWTNIKDTARYIAAWTASTPPEPLPTSDRETLTDVQKKMEKIALGLRRSDGISLDLLSGAQKDRIPDLEEEGYAQVVGSSLALTPEGMLLADPVCVHLLS